MSMLLKGRNGNEFELSFVRDSLPETQDGFGDARWTTVLFRAANQEDSWEESAPCVNLFEFQNLAEWLAAVAGGSEAPGDVESIELLEPELAFSLSGQTDKDVTIRIGFHLAERPEEFNVDAETEEAEFIDLHVSRHNVGLAAATLRDELLGLENEPKDDLTGQANQGVLGEPDPGMNIVDRIRETPPGAGTGEDNAGDQ
ncbi:MAG: hypothetical protein U0570_12445 [Phycisphaerales bacterium]